MIPENFKALVWEFYNAMSTITLGDNFSAQIVQAVIGANTEVKIPHRLGVVPKYRLILRCLGSSEIVDGLNEWTNTEIYLKNTNIAVQSTVTVMILRG
jgi:hypothetical protein